MVKLRFERLKPRQSGEGSILVAEESDLEVHGSEGLEILKFQVRGTKKRLTLKAIGDASQSRRSTL